MAAVGISKVYRQGVAELRALDDISFTLARGAFVGLSGPSGSGKTSLLNIIGLTDAPSSGTVHFHGTAVNYEAEQDLARLRRTRIGYVFQYFNLLPSLTALENVEICGLLAGQSRADARAQSQHLLTSLGLAKRMQHFPEQLSGGEMQRVALCRATIHSPELVLADEPTGNLDTQNGVAVLDLLQQSARAGRTVLMATHNSDALDRCDKVIRLVDGKVVT